MKVHPDFDEFITHLKDNNVNFVIVGAFALAFHGHPRSTGDLDIWVKPEVENAESLIRALNSFGFESQDISVDQILSNDIIQLGYQPVRIDIISNLTGIRPDELWDKKKMGMFGKHVIYYMPLDLFIRNKKAMGRMKDLSDIEIFEK